MSSSAYLNNQPVLSSSTNKDSTVAAGGMRIRSPAAGFYSSDDHQETSNRSK